MTQDEIDAWVERQMLMFTPESKRRAIEVLATYLKPHHAKNKKETPSSGNC